MKRIAPIRVVVFCLVAACAGLCQSGHAGLKSAKQQHALFKTLPDAPSAQVLNWRVPGQEDELQTVSKEAALPHLPAVAGPAGVNAAVVREAHAGIVLPEAPSATLLSATSQYKPVPLQNIEVRNEAPNKGDAFFSKYLNPSKLNQAPRYQPSSRDKVMDRATDAASRIFVTRDESGNRKLNTNYFLRVLTSVAADSASRRYRARSGAAPLTDFGSTIGGDAGRNLLHEFGPGIRQIVTSHMPAFVFRIQDRVVRQQSPRPASSVPAR
jgi:hypothetical protein